MQPSDFEGTVVLEKLASVGKLDDFFEAIDSDDFGKIKSLMKSAGIDGETISVVLKMIADMEG